MTCSKTLSVVDDIQVAWKGKFRLESLDIYQGLAWWSAIVVDKSDGLRYKIHYPGWDSRWDEWVHRDRLRWTIDQDLQTKIGPNDDGTLLLLYTSPGGPSFQKIWWLCSLLAFINRGLCAQQYQPEHESNMKRLIKQCSLYAVEIWCCGSNVPGAWLEAKVRKVKGQKYCVGRVLSSGALWVDRERVRLSPKGARNLGKGRDTKSFFSRENSSVSSSCSIM